MRKWFQHNKKKVVPLLLIVALFASLLCLPQIPSASNVKPDTKPQRQMTYSPVNVNYTWSDEYNNQMPQNPNAETGDLSGWTMLGGEYTWSASTEQVYHGSYSFAGFANASLGSSNLVLEQNQKYISANSLTIFCFAVRLSNVSSIQFLEMMLSVYIGGTYQSIHYDLAPTLLGPLGILIGSASDTWYYCVRNLTRDCNNMGLTGTVSDVESIRIYISDWGTGENVTGYIDSVFLVKDKVISRGSGYINFMFSNATQSGLDRWGYDSDGLFGYKNSTASQAGYYVGTNMTLANPGYNGRYLRFKETRTIYSYTSPATVFMNASHWSSGWVKDTSLILWQNGVDYYADQLVSQTYTYSGVNKILVSFAMNINQARILYVVPFLVVVDDDVSALPAPTITAPYYGYESDSTTVLVTWTNVTAPPNQSPLDHFQLEVDQDVAFTTNPIYISNISKATVYYNLKISSFFGYGIYFIRIRGVSTTDANGTWSYKIMFQVLPVAEVYINTYDANTPNPENWNPANFNIYYYTSVSHTYWSQATPPSVPSILMYQSETVNITITDLLGSTVVANTRYTYPTNKTLNIPLNVMQVKVKSYGENAFGAACLYRAGYPLGGGQVLLGESDIDTWYVFPGIYTLSVYYSFVVTNGHVVPLQLWINQTYDITPAYYPLYCAGFLVANASLKNIIDVLKDVPGNLETISIQLSPGGEVFNNAAAAAGKLGNLEKDTNLMGGGSMTIVGILASVIPFGTVIGWIIRKVQPPPDQEELIDAKARKKAQEIVDAYIRGGIGPTVVPDSTGTSTHVGSYPAKPRPRRKGR